MTKTVQDIKQITESVHGWLTPKEGSLLYNLAQCVNEGEVVVEVGSWKGKSTIWLAAGVKNAAVDVPVYAIDPHTGASEHKKRYDEVWTFDVFKENIKKAGIESVVTPIVKTSKEAEQDVREPVGLIFIDGAHEYELVKLDFELWFPKVVEGGRMAFHDTNGRPGPTKVVRELVYFSKNFKDVYFVDSITVATKVKENTFIDRVRNFFMYLYRELTIVSYRVKRLIKMIRWQMKKRLK